MGECVVLCSNTTQWMLNNTISLQRQTGRTKRTKSSSIMDQASLRSVPPFLQDWVTWGISWGYLNQHSIFIKSMWIESSCFNKGAVFILQEGYSFPQKMNEMMWWLQQHARTSGSISIHWPLCLRLEGKQPQNTTVNLELGSHKAGIGCTSSLN